MLKKRMTPSRAGVDEVVHDSGSALLLDSRQRRQRLLGWLPQSAPRRGGFGCVLNHLFLFKTPLLSEKRPCCLLQGIFIPPC